MPDSRTLPPALLLLACLSVAACSPGARTVTTDLLRHGPDAVGPTRTIRAGDEATRQLVRGGFTVAEGGVLQVGPDAEAPTFGFRLTEPAETQILLRGTFASAEGAVYVNDAPLGGVPLPDGRGDAVVTVPARMMKPHLNWVTVEFRPPAHDARRPRAALESIAIGNGGEPVRTRTEPPALEQTPGSEASWLIAPDQERLELAGAVVAPAGTTGGVDVLAETDGRPDRILWSEAIPAGGALRLERDLDLRALRGEPSRVSVRFRASRPEAVLRWTRVRASRVARPGPRRTSRPLPSPPNVVVFLVDTLRRDHLSLYGYPRPTSPALDHFGAEALVFDDAWTQSSWTNATVASLFTGEYPLAHGVRDHHGVLPEAFLTLAELLRSRGYATAALVANAGVPASLGFGQGFDAYDVVPDQPSARLVDAALRRVGPRPFFLYVHATEPHYPYVQGPALDGTPAAPPAPTIRTGELTMAKLRRGRTRPTPAELAYLVSLYDSEITVVDRAFGALVDGLKQRGLYDSTLIVFVSDHGEEFADHGGFYHGHTLYNELVRGALVVKPAGAFAPRAVHVPVQTIDVYPTIAAAVGVARDELPGRDLLLPAAADEERPIFSATDLRDHLRSVVAGGRKLVLQDRRDEGVADRVWLYDPVADPQETGNRRPREPIRSDFMAALLRRHLEEVGPRAAAPQRRSLDPETVEHLRALGYIEVDGR